MDGYLTCGKAKSIYQGGSKYSLQCFQGDHEDEYTLKKDGKVLLFQNGVMEMSWQEDEDGNQIGDFTRYMHGCVSFIESFDDILDQHDFRRIVNHVRGERLEIYSHDTNKLKYHGEFNEKRKREGRGIEYDAKTGAMLLEGIWKNNKLVEILRKIEGSIMIEFKRNGDNTEASNRIPVYVGEFIYDEEKESFIRNGRGYLIDEETRIATRECEWKDGKKVSGRDLYDGWYTRSISSKPKPKSTPVPKPDPVETTKPVQICITTPLDLNSLDLKVTDLVIGSNNYDNVQFLDLSKFEKLRSIEIKDGCFSSVRSFRIEGLHRLKTLKIGDSAFTNVYRHDWYNNRRNYQYWT